MLMYFYAVARVLIILIIAFVLLHIAGLCLYLMLKSW
jgi:hypothetical protein